MAVLPIQITGEPVLHTPAEAVTVFDDELRTLVSDMVDTMTAAPGVGLAAPQVGVSKQIFVYDWTDDAGTRWHGCAINPQLWIIPPPVHPLDEDEEQEGCLSVPGERFPLRRSERALLTAVDVEGNPFQVEAAGWLARIFQHEFDHLGGILYVDRLEFRDAKGAAKAVRKAGWGTPGLSWMPGVDDLDA